eukprot:2002245-Rhodomonas_salina.1
MDKMSAHLPRVRSGHGKGRGKLGRLGLGWRDRKRCATSRCYPDPYCTGDRDCTSPAERLITFGTRWDTFQYRDIQY